MAFEFNWAPTPIPTKLINPNMRAASEAMQGYVPAEADPSKYVATPGIKATEQMQGYTPALANYSLPNTPVKEQEMQGGNRVPSNVSDELGKGWIYTQQQEQAAAKQQQVDSLKARIQQLESQIATNQAKLNNWSTPAGEIAALEARKINAQDPTSIWRWKEGIDQQRLQRQEDLARVEAEKKLNEAKNIELNRNKIDNILSSTMSNPSMTRDKLEMALKQLNDAEELAKQYKDTDSLKKINARKNELGIYVPVDDEANVIESEFVKNMEMVGKQGGMDKKQFAQYVQSVLDDPDNKHIWHYSPELQRKLYAAIGKNTSTQPANYEGY